MFLETHVLGPGSELSRMLLSRLFCKANRARPFCRISSPSLRRSSWQAIRWSSTSPAAKTSPNDFAIKKPSKQGSYVFALLYLTLFGSLPGALHRLPCRHRTFGFPRIPQSHDYLHLLVLLLSCGTNSLVR